LATGILKKTDPVIVIKGVAHSFGQGDSRVQVLFDNNLTLYPGEIVIMTGPSGSGKTTLLTLIGALRSVQKGSLKIMGQELFQLNPSKQAEIRKNIGFIFQAHNLFDSLTAFQNVKLATQLFHLSSREATQRTRDILCQVELDDHMHKRPSGLSGGQGQRVAIARGLVNRPKIVLADEPTAALDKDTGRLVVNIFKELAQKTGSTILIVTHDNRILDVADRIINMVDGYITSDIDVAESLTIAGFLKKCPVFQSATPTLTADIANKMERQHARAGQVIFREGDPGDLFYILFSGSVDITQTQGEKEVLLLSLDPGNFFGELALLEKKPRAATVTATSDCEFLTLSQAEFDRVVQASAPFEEQLRLTYFTS
jgi:putative ABC transport system ATP-binding protein